MSSPASFTSSANYLPSYDPIQGLRQQILANAVILFPQIVATSTATEPTKAFQVITTRENNSSRALLLYGDGPGKKVIAKGAPSGSGGGDSGSSEIEQALEGLLNVTSESLGWYTTTLVGELEQSEEVANGGAVNFTKVEEGFHFVAVERWAENK